jgi:hypothetical protein
LTWQNVTDRNDPDLGDHRMSRSTLARHRFTRTSAEGGGGGSTGENSGGTANAQKTEATDDDGRKLGFPADTPTVDMTSDERANYWRNQAKVQQKKVPANLAELQDKAKKWDDYQKSQKTPEQQAAQQQSQADADKIKRDAAANAAEVSLRAILQSNGKKTDEIDDLLGIVDFTRFLTDDAKVDPAKVSAFVSRNTGAGGGNPDIGQGNHGSQPVVRGDAGKAAAEARFGNRNSGGQSRYGALSRRS